MRLKRFDYIPLLFSHYAILIIIIEIFHKIMALLITPMAVVLFLWMLGVGGGGGNKFIVEKSVCGVSNENISDIETVSRAPV